MKKIIKSILLVVLLLFPAAVFALGDITVSPDTLTIEVGSSKTFKITAYNTIGDITISSSDSTVAKVSESFWSTEMVDELQTIEKTITVQGLKEGNAVITLTLDAATFDMDDLEGQTRTLIVSVVSKSTSEESKSTNNKLKSIKVEGYELTKVDDNTYTLKVGPKVESINVIATPEDKDATVTGDGEHTLGSGENVFQLIVTSQSGSDNIITIKVTREKVYYVEDLEEALDSNTSTINIIIDDESTLTEEDIQKIVESEKTVNLDYYSINGELIYSWILDGSKITSTNRFITTVTQTSTNKGQIESMINNEAHVFINTQDNNIPNGTKLYLYVGSQFTNGEVVGLYAYNKSANTLELVSDKVVVNDEFVLIDVESGKEYVLVRNPKVSVDNTSVKKSKSAFIIPFVVIFLPLTILAIILIKRNKKDKNQS